MADNDIKEYKPTEVCRRLNPNSTFPLIVLNQPLDHYINDPLILDLWKGACYKLLCDGGANQFYNYLIKMKLNAEDFLPDVVTGDFDSITPENMEFLKKKCNVVHTPDQDFTDFNKALILLLDEMEKRQIKPDFIVAIVNTAGRFDHIMGNIQTLFDAKTRTDIPIYLLTDKSLIWLLDKGKHRIIVDEELMRLSCGLIPIGEPCQHVTTTGLKWDLNDSLLHFGGLISTSNTYTHNVVTVDTDKPLVWTMEIHAGC